MENGTFAFYDEQEILPADQQETEEDVSPKPESVSQAVLFNTDWTVETIHRQVQKLNINLDPKFQRREAWDDARKSRLIESIICGFPIPNIVLAEDATKKGRYIVIDGKQRLFSLVSFMNDELELRSLSVRKDLNGFNYSRMLSEFPDIITNLENQPIRTVIIRAWPDEDFLYTVFYRLNSGSLPLSSQELRKALHGGRLLDYIDDYISVSNSFINVFGNTPDRRMRDVELVLRFIAFQRFYDDYSGNLKKFLDDTVTFYDKNWEKENEDLDKHLSSLDTALDIAIEVFGSDAFKKWNGSNFEKRMNRAVFDVIARFFSDATNSHTFIEHKDLIKAEFKDVCLFEPFRSAIEKTTKTPKAVLDRHLIWGTALEKVTGKHFDTGSMRLV